MIVEDSYWIWIAATNAEGHQPAGGKWLYFGEANELHSWTHKLNELVEAGELLSAKIARKLSGLDPVPHKPCVVCVYTYADDRAKAKARNTLRKALGIEVSVWKSEAETKDDWDAGGALRSELEGLDGHKP